MSTDQLLADQCKSAVEKFYGMVADGRIQVLAVEQFMGDPITIGLDGIPDLEHCVTFRFAFVKESK